MQNNSYKSRTRTTHQNTARTTSLRTSRHAVTHCRQVSSRRGRRDAATRFFCSSRDPHRDGGLARAVSTDRAPSRAARSATVVRAHCVRPWPDNNAGTTKTTASAPICALFFLFSLPLFRAQNRTNAHITARGGGPAGLNQRRIRMFRNQTGRNWSFFVRPGLPNHQKPTAYNVKGTPMFNTFLFSIIRDVWKTN